ncbi:MAG: hypothetical protein BWK80_38140 [Desulfobacteraceae bacterium IS3]|nr:MAG: hypothetical protein BWK80_38140 [Desulfobacteraceae bacterium IS3]
MYKNYADSQQFPVPECAVCFKSGRTRRVGTGKRKKIDSLTHQVQVTLMEFPHRKKKAEFNCVTPDKNKILLFSNRI